MFTNQENSLHFDTEIFFGKKLKCTLPNTPLQQCCQSHPLEKLWDKCQFSLSLMTDTWWAEHCKISYRRTLWAFLQSRALGFVYLYGCGRIQENTVKHQLKACSLLGCHTQILLSAFCCAAGGPTACPAPSFCSFLLLKHRPQLEKIISQSMSIMWHWEAPVKFTAVTAKYYVLSMLQ